MRRAERESLAMRHFQALIAPVTSETFFERIYEREALHVQYRPWRLAWLAEEIDPFRIVRESCANWGEVSLARAGMNPDECPHTRQPPNEKVVRRAFAEGYTIVINNLQAKDRAAAQLCRRFEQAFFCRANVNLYMTAPQSMGLACHYDDDDVFILQLGGCKHWRTYRHLERLPLGRHDYRPSADWGQAEDLLLEPGDVMYLPRGTPHEARTGSELSLHLTVSLNVVRWAELASELIYALAGRETALRHAVPLALLRRGEPLPAVIPRFLEDLLEDETLRMTALERVQWRLLAGAPRLDGSMPSLGTELEADEMLKVADDQLWATLPDGDGLIIQAIGARFELGGDTRDLASVLDDGQPFCAANLPSTWPLERRLEIMRRLVEAGLLAPAVG